MSMTDHVATARISREVQEFERLLVAAHAAAAALAASCATARTDLNLGIVAGHREMLLIARVQDMLLRSCADTARLHAGLRDIATERETMMPDEECPSLAPSGTLIAA